MTRRLLHADTAGYVLTHDFDGEPMVWGHEIFPDMETALEERVDAERVYDQPLTVMAIVGLERFGPELAPCTHRRLRQITHALLRCEDCGAELDS